MIVKLGLATGAACAAFINGAPTSPLFDPVLFLLRPALAPLPMNSEVLFHFATVFIAFVTLILGGIPAAIWERTRRLRESSLGSMTVWLLATLIIALPGILAMTGYFDID